jgi:hypothetical protein
MRNSPKRESRHEPISAKTQMHDGNIALIDRVIDSCKELLNHTSFWLLAGMADKSFEEGDRFGDFGDWVVELERMRVPSGLTRQLSAGINKNLKETIEQRHVNVHVKHQPDRGADLILSDKGGGSAHVRACVDAPQ